MIGSLYTSTITSCGTSIYSIYISTSTSFSSVSIISDSSYSVDSSIGSAGGLHSSGIYGNSVASSIMMQRGSTESSSSTN